jgi:hypothetical protein
LPARWSSGPVLRGWYWVVSHVCIFNVARVKTESSRLKTKFK